MPPLFSLHTLQNSKGCSRAVSAVGGPPLLEWPALDSPEEGRSRNGGPLPTPSSLSTQCHQTALLGALRCAVGRQTWPHICLPALLYIFSALCHSPHFLVVK